MKKRFSSILILIGMAAIVVLAESNIIAGLIKIWRESSFIDFADGQFENTVLEEKNGGQIRLPHPMQPVKQEWQKK